MNIFLTIPGFVPHGGTRVILEWANRLSAFHKVFLYSRDRRRLNWFNLDKKVQRIATPKILKCCHCLIVCSPHDVELLTDPDRPERCFVFMQMLEHMFKPSNPYWIAKCKKFYLTEYPLISISKWNIQELRKMGRKSPIYYVGNGVNINDFPIYEGNKSGDTVLIEGWQVTNPTKDAQRIAPRVARRLKDMGYKIKAYGQLPLDGVYDDVLDRYYRFPSLRVLNTLYEEAAILLKASVCDARSCSPMEAMAKGAVPVRAIEYGDDDLIDGHNCLRVGYDEEELFQAAVKVLTDTELQLELRVAGHAYIREYSWSYWINEIDNILSTHYGQ